MKGGGEKMSILIKELRLPAERLYPLHLTIYSDGSVFCGHGIGKRSYEAIEVPVPHGRLGDLDVLRAKMYHEAFETDSQMQKWDSGCWIRYKMFERMEEAAPTIIPAEEETT